MTVTTTSHRTPRLCCYWPIEGCHASRSKRLRTQCQGTESLIPSTTIAPYDSLIHHEHYLCVYSLCRIFNPLSLNHLFSSLLGLINWFDSHRIILSITLSLTNSSSVKAPSTYHLIWVIMILYYNTYDSYTYIYARAVQSTDHISLTLCVELKPVTKLK